MLHEFREKRTKIKKNKKNLCYWMENKFWKVTQLKPKTENL